MNRRKAIFGSILGGLGLWVAKPKKPSGRFFITIHQNVGNLPPAEAKTLCERLIQQIKASKPNDCLNVMVLPQRGYETWCEVFSLDGDQPSGEIEAFVYEVNERKNEQRT